MEGMTVPAVDFKIRVRDEQLAMQDEPNPYKWSILTAEQIFDDKKVLLFSLPGAFTPTCSTYQLPNFEKLYNEFKEKHNIDEIYCVSVNDAFVMGAWKKQQNIQNVKMIPDGTGEFTRLMGMLVKKDNLGFGYRSWRYAAVVDNWVISDFYEEPGREDNCEDDPYGETDPTHIINNLNSNFPAAWPFPTSESVKNETD